MVGREVASLCNLPVPGWEERYPPYVAQVPWWVVYSGVYARVYIPGYTTVLPSMLEVIAATVHGRTGPTALVHRLAELNIGDNLITVLLTFPVTDTDVTIRHR